MDDADSTGKNNMDYARKFGEWIECRKCRSLMFDTFQTCWKCGIVMAGNNKVPVRL